MATSDSIKSDAAFARFDATAVAGFTRMVRAGVDHTLMQLVSEAFDLIQRTQARSDEPFPGFSRSRDIGPLDDFLAEASGHLLAQSNQSARRRSIGERLDNLKNDPSSSAIILVARELNVPVPTIDAALGSQSVSPRERQTSFILTLFRHPAGRFATDPDSILKEINAAFYVTVTIAYSQAFALLSEAARRHRFELDLARVARAWNTGYGAHGELLDDIAAAFQATPSLHNILCDEDLSEKVMDRQEFLRHSVWRAGELDMIVPAMLASLDYLDSSKDAWLPVNLIQVRPLCSHRRLNKNEAPAPNARTPEL